jgi:hypothetical protein
MLVPSSDIRKEGCNFFFPFVLFFFLVDPACTLQAATARDTRYGIGTCTRELLKSLDIEI